MKRNGSKVFRFDLICVCQFITQCFSVHSRNTMESAQGSSIRLAELSWRPTRGTLQWCFEIWDWRSHLRR